MSLTPDESVSATRHIHAGCECRLVPAPVQQIGAILEQGKIPLLRVKTSGTDKLALGTTSYEIGKKYVVISPHVPESVASPVSNTIATCQLIRVADRLGRLQVEEVHGELFFWLDSLCIPALGCEDASEPMGSIDKSGICDNAYAILAIDDRFLGMNKQTTPEETRTVLRSSDWTTQFSRTNGQVSCTRILLMASIGFIDLRDMLGTDMVRLILNGDDPAEIALPDS